MKKEKLTYLNPVELAERLNVHYNTLKMWRRHKKGPAYVRVGREIRYPMHLLLAWEKGLLVDPQKTATHARPTSIFGFN